MANKKNKIKVSLGTSFKRSAVMLGKSGEVLEEGENSAQLARKLYGRR